MWALDFGTTNSALARWDELRRKPSLVELPDICRGPSGRPVDPEQEHLEASLVVPTSVEAFDRLNFWGTVGKWPALQRVTFVGRQAYIGREADIRQDAQPSPAYASMFKALLGSSPLRTVARVGSSPLTAREAARLYLRELLHAVRDVTGERIRDLVVTSPVQSFESYRAELSAALRSLGVRRVRFIDEPVAAALGYGLGLGKERKVLVVDFGGGTLDIAYVQLTAKNMEQGQCEVLGKSGKDIGGLTIDRWLAEALCRRMEIRFEKDEFMNPKDDWTRRMLVESRRLKERLFFREEATLVTVPRDELHRFDERMRGRSSTVTLKRDDLVELLESWKVYEAIDSCVAASLAQADATESDVDEVLLVGGSTLLPQVYQRFEKRFGRDAVRAWQPFEAVAQGASIYAAGKAQPSDFIIHDYAFVTHDLQSHQKQYAVVVPRGTRFPTRYDFWKSNLVPTCSLGEPETMFKLVVCELGRSDGDTRFSWDERGNLRILRADDSEEQGVVVVPLNESNPLLGFLRPPHPPDDKRPRLEVAFGVNSERWLCATVFDLKTRRYMMREEPVVRLL
ncbi:MAG: Hsp70 family protein [Myxococcota bacterium]